MLSRLNNNEQADLLKRLQQFINTPANERTVRLPGMKFEHCESGEELFNIFCMGEPTEATDIQKTEFLSHFPECLQCYNGFLRFIFMSTGD